MGIVDLIKSWFGKGAKQKTPPMPARPAERLRADKPAAKPAAAPAAPKATPKPASRPVSRATPAEAKPAETGGENSLADMVFGSAQFSIRLMAVGKIEDEAVLADIVVRHPIAKIRQTAAEKMHNRELIAATASKIKHKDKGVYRLLRQKLDAAASAAKDAERQGEHLKKICADLEAQLRQSGNPLFAAKVQSLRDQWQKLTARQSAPADLDQRYHQAEAAVLELLERQQQARHAETEARDSQQQVVTRLGELQAALAEPAMLDALPAELSTLAQRWQDSSAVLAPEPGLARRMNALRQELDTLLALHVEVAAHADELNGLIRQLAETPGAAPAAAALEARLKDWAMHTGPHLPALLNEARQALAGADQVWSPTPVSSEEAAPPAKPAAQASAEFDALLAQVSAGLAAGDTRTADQQLRQAQHYAREHGLHDVRLHQLTQELHKMKDWASFAVLPKKEALVARMAALAAQAECDPQQRHEDVKALQAEWQTLGTVHNSAERTLWRQFKDLGQQAYQPCQRYFDEQKAIQATNATRREALCDELQYYLDHMPATVNWQGHIAILKKAREDWQQHHPVEAKKHKKLQARFNALLKALDDRLQAEYAAQEARKQELITQAAALTTSADVPAACDQAKALQQAWKDTGSCGHVRDQALWESFRGHCDTIFARREQLKAAQQTEDEQTIDVARALLANFQAALDGELTPDSEQVVDEVMSTFKSLYLPREANTELRKQFSTLRTQWQRKLQFQVDSAKTDQLLHLDQVLQRCITAENQPEPALAAEQLQEWIAQQALPAPYRSALKKRWQALRDDSPADGERLAQLNYLCLLMELVLDLPETTPDPARTAKKMALFQQQSYPRTPEEKKTLLLLTLGQALQIGGLTGEAGIEAGRRLSAILRSPQLAESI